MRDSGSLYFKAVGKHWAFLVLLLIGLVGDVETVHSTIHIPALVFLVLTAVGLIGAQFRAFHDMRVERDEARKERDQAIQCEQDLRNDVAYRVQLSQGNPDGIRARWGTPAEDGTLSLDVIVALRNGYARPVSFSMEAMSLQIGTAFFLLGAAINAPPTHGTILPGHTHEFQVSWSLPKLQPSVQPGVWHAFGFVMLYGAAGEQPAVRSEQNCKVIFPAQRSDELVGLRWFDWREQVERLEGAS